MKLAMYMIVMVALCGVARADSKPAGRPAPSGVLKAYKGPEGEIVAMVEVNDGKQMLVYFKHLGGELEGKSVLYLYEDLGKGDKNVYLNKKRGSKTYRSVILSARDNRWSFYHPTKPGTELALRYSEKESGDLKIADVIDAYKP
ncbi:MAG TPA: hypothetical protein VFT22_37110 [Kofleriaceae bacterium]|nr:hypothetical protein [Kofleriaceae bacterium]